MTEICILYALLGGTVGALIERIVAYRKLKKEIEIWRSAGEVASKYKYKLTETENAYNKANEDGMELACKLSDKEIKIKHLEYDIEIKKEIIARQKRTCEVFADKLLKNGINVTLSEIEDFNSIQWGQKEYEHYKSKQKS